MFKPEACANCAEQLETWDYKVLVDGEWENLCSLCHSDWNGRFIRYA